MASVTEIPVKSRETERAEAVYPRLGEAQGGGKKREADSSQWCPVTEQEAMGKN